MDADTLRRRRYGLIPSMISAMLGPSAHPAIRAVADKRLSDSRKLLGHGGTLRHLAIACRAEDGLRLDRLAMDLTALIRVYETLEAETDDPATIASTDAKVDLPGKSGERFSVYAASASKRHGLLYPRAECRLIGL